MCGMGKTSWAIQHINENPQSPYIYITPLLSEVDRVKENTKVRFFDPKIKGKRKIDDFNDLLINGENVVSTHATFANSTLDTLTYLEQGHYTLFLDEVIDVVIPYNDLVNGVDRPVKPGDVRLLIEQGFIEVDDYGAVKWTGPSYSSDGYAYGTIERLAKRGCLLFINNTMFLWEFPVDIFKAFKEIYVMTYMFKGSQLHPFFKYHDIEYERMNVVKNDDGYQIVPYRGDDAKLDIYKSLLELNQDQKLNQYNGSALSSSWYDRNAKSKEEIEAKRMKSNLTNFFRNKNRAKANQIMWTCPKKHMKSVAGAGYTRVRRLTPEENQLPTKERERVEREVSCCMCHLPGCVICSRIGCAVSLRIYHALLDKLRVRCPYYGGTPGCFR